MSTTTNSPDGRSTRWDEHRAQRRRELIDAALRAIRKHGAGVGMDDIAAMAGTSKTVVYRHFTDRAGLYAAVAERVESLIVRDLGTALEHTIPAGRRSAPTSSAGRAVLAAAIDSYLTLVERDPEVYRFIVTAPVIDSAEASGRQDLRGVMSHVASEIASVLSAALDPERSNANAIRVWGIAVVGMVHAAADDWIRPGGSSAGMPRAQLVEQLTELTWSGLSASWPA